MMVMLLWAKVQTTLKLSEPCKTLYEGYIFQSLGFPCHSIWGESLEAVCVKDIGAASVRAAKAAACANILVI